MLLELCVYLDLQRMKNNGLLGFLYIFWAIILHTFWVQVYMSLKTHATDDSRCSFMYSLPDFQGTNKNCVVYHVCTAPLTAGGCCCQCGHETKAYLSYVELHMCGKVYRLDSERLSAGLTCGCKNERKGAARSRCADKKPWS